MARCARNAGVVYSGAVGAKMRPRSYANRRQAVLYERWQCIGGPLDRKSVRTEKNGDGRTAVFTLRGQTGFYECGVWVAVG